LPFDPAAPPLEEPPAVARRQAPRVADTAAHAVRTDVRGPGLTPRVEPVLAVHPETAEQWVRSNVRAQKQDGYAVVTVTVPLGDLTSAQLRVLADLAAAYSDGTVRTTHGQNLVLRWVPARSVPELYGQLAATGLGLPGAGTIADPVSCPGAESCRLAVTQSRGLARLLGEHVRAGAGLADAAADLDVRISGCPNGCGQHHVAGIGFQGSVRRLDGRAVPQYFVMVGGGTGEGGAHFARLAAKVPARRAGEALERLVALYRAEAKAGETAKEFFRRVDVGRVKAVLADLEVMAREDARPADFVDLGEETEFRVETMEGECSA
jgi:sulfite reductase (NADPH) hemoprotein beta-component